MENSDRIYFDYQSTTPPDPKVLREMRIWEGESFGNPHSVDHIFGWQAAQAVEKAASLVAALIGADQDEIVFTSGATEANNLALLGIGRRAASGARRRILASVTEHKSVLAACRALEAQCGYQLELLPVDHEGRIIVEALHEALGEDVLFVSVMAVNNEIGVMQPLEAIASAAQKCGALFHCDAAQAPCALDISSIATYADLVSLSAHKFYGPKGIGTLYARRDLHDHIEPLIYGGGQQHNLRSGTVPVPLCVGMGKAAELACAPAAAKERQTVRALAGSFVCGLSEAGIAFTVNGPAGNERHPGNLSIRFHGGDAHEILGALQPHLAASTGSACTTGTPEPSHVLRAIGLSYEEANATVRFSLGRQTTEAEIDRAVLLVSETLAALYGLTAQPKSKQA